MLIVVVAVLLVAQGEGEGEGEGEDPCAPVCVDDTTLTFCDGDTERTLACADVAVGAVCAQLSEAWGFDCLVPAGTPCDPDYGFGASRCAAGLVCREGVCATGAAEPPAPLTPTNGTVIDGDSTATASAVGCAGCPQSGAAVLPLALVLRRRRRPAPTKPKGGERISGTTACATADRSLDSKRRDR